MFEVYDIIASLGMFEFYSKPSTDDLLLRNLVVFTVIRIPSKQ